MYIQETEHVIFFRFDIWKSYFSEDQGFYRFISFNQPMICIEISMYDNNFVRYAWSQCPKRPSNYEQNVLGQKVAFSGNEKRLWSETIWLVFFVN